MDNDTCTTERILDLILKILFLLTGEDYTVVKKTCPDKKTSSNRHVESGERRAIRDYDTFPTYVPVTHEKNEEILQLTSQVIQLLTGEVPVRSQDVAVCFSIDESEYMDQYKNLYRNIIMDNYQLSSQAAEQAVVKHEIKDDFIEEPLHDLNTATIW
ncbi:hypothetical protein GDO81_004989 [Engystomops pustulosus]|uniref:KRAB domain-containing protein n=1 Tax=Engystomops pustulosus TaxID=76066 RepID=A0AAV7CKW6_ENGPU|nr:hypothetical protein GDO81_004989 [Engystomops pustulosus]